MRKTTYRAPLWVLVLLVTAAASAVAAPQTAPAPRPAPAACPRADIARGLEGAIAHVRYLADDALEGRGAATLGERCAAEYIAAHFRQLGLAPAGEDGGYFQTFPLRIGARLGATNALRLPAGSYTAGQDWIPYGFSGSAAVQAPALYGAYGITRPGDPNDTYSRLDLSGKIVVLEAGDPESPNGRSLYADPHFKARVAEGRGAAGVIILLPNAAALPDPDGELRPAGRAPAIAVRGPLADAVRQAAQAGSVLELRTAVEPRLAEAHNVLALLPGANPALREQIIVIGAHLDHLGRGGEGSLAPDEYGTIHNGADDNASGVAVLIEAARRLATRPDRPGHSVLFIGFSGEERGLLGSAHFVENPTAARDNIIAMLNLDMVGRLRDNSLAVMGVGTAAEWRDILGRANDRLPQPLRLGLTDDGFGPSDHSSFYARGIPVLHFFTNSHEDYHRPSDDWQKLNVEGLERIADLVTEVTRNVAARTQLTAIVQAQDPHAGAAPAAPSSDQGYGPYLGTIPDFTPVDSGVRITGVREGSPAQQAGLQAGDVIVGFDGTEITDLYAYTYALRARKPGDTVKIEVLRGDQRITFTAVLGQR